jgi:hypothetical protein
MFVVFDTEEKLNSHLINKHKVVDTKKKINDMFFGDKPKENKKPEMKGKKNEFNFSQYIEELKERMNEFSKNIVSQRTQYNEEHTNYEQYDETYNHYQNSRGGGGKGKKRGGGGGGYNNDYNNYDSGYGQQNSKGKRKVIMTELPQYNPGEGLSIGEQVQRANYGGYKQQPEEKAPLVNAEIDYGFVFECYYKILKDYIKARLAKEKLKENDFVIPKETQYQLIIIIDKLDNQKLSELQSLANFGIDLDRFKDLKRIVGQGLSDERELFKVLDGLEFRKVLIIYKYFQVSWKKIDNKFYKLGK